MAGKMTKTNVIGYIASFPIPEVIRGINAMTLAAQKVNPDIKTKIVWVFTWYDPGKESEAAQALIDQGADIIMQHTDSTAPVQVAEKAGVWPNSSFFSYLNRCSTISVLHYNISSLIN